MRVEAFDERGGAQIQSALQLRSVLAQSLEHCARRGERERMAHEGAGKEGDADLGDGVVAEAPGSAIERVEEARVAGDDPDRQAAAEHLAVGRKIRLHAEHGLRSAGMHAEAGDDLVEHQCGAGLGRDRAQLVQEFPRLQIGPPALHRFHQHGGKLVGVGPDGLERAVLPVLEDDDVVRHRVRNARCDRLCCGHAVAHPWAYQHLVEDAVIGAGEHDDLVAAGHRARGADRGRDRLRSRIAERCALHADGVAHELRDLAGDRRLRADLDAGVELALERGADELRIVPEEDRAEAVHEIDVLVAVDVPQARALRALGHDRIDDLLPVAAGSRHWSGDPTDGRDAVRSAPSTVLVRRP